MSFAERLKAAGFGASRVAEKEDQLARCEAALSVMTGVSAERVAFFVPGRIEVLGKHTDYAGGRSILCAVEQGFVFLVAPRTDDRVLLTDVRRGEVGEARLDPRLRVQPAGWSHYAAVVTRRIARNFPNARRGADIAFLSDLPAASGMSSSSALMIGIFLALAATNALSEQPTYCQALHSAELLAEYLGAMENGASFGDLEGDEGVGTFGGSQDHTAILCSRPGILSQYAFRPVRFERDVPLPETHCFVVAFSGIAAEKTGAARERYNAASAGVAHIMTLWNRAMQRTDASLADALASDPDAHVRLRMIIGHVPDESHSAHQLLDRVEQFALEAFAIVPAAMAALKRDDLTSFGKLVDRSQHLAETHLANQIPETIALARLAREHGAEAASAFGAGFGGSVWALVTRDRAESFADRWRSAYRREHPAAANQARVLVTLPGPAGFRVER